MNRLWTTLVAVVAVFCLAPASWGQQGGALGGAASGAAGRTSGSSTTAGFGSSNVPTTGFSLSSRFSSNFDRYMGGSQAVGQTTAGAAAATSGVFGQSANSMGGMGGMGTMGNSRNMSSFNRALGMGMGMGRGMGSNRNGMMGQNGMGNNRNNRALRTRMRLGFTAPLGSATPVGIQRAVTKVSDILLREQLASKPIAAELVGSVVVLRGTVESEHGRELAERLALLEPGIWEVQNELIVGPLEPTPATVPISSSSGQTP